MIINNILRHFFCRKNNIAQKFSYEQLVQHKWNHLTKYSRRYASQQQFQHQDKFYQEHVYGHPCYIAAVTQHSFKSQIFSKSVMKYADPSLLILGGINDNYLRYEQSMMRIRQFYDHPIYKPQKMPCKERLSKIIQTKLQQDMDFFWDDQKKEMFQINHRQKRIFPVDYLTVAHMASIQNKTKIILGKPSDQLVFEDIIMRYSLKQLQQIVARAVKKIQQRQPNQTNWRQSFTLEAIQNYVMSQQPQIYSRQLTYQTALLKRFAKIQEKILMLVPGYFVHRISQQVHHMQIKPQSVFRDGLEDPHSSLYYQLQKIYQEGNIDEILQKFALITLMKQNWIQREFENGVNVLQYMSFGKLFKDMQIEQLQARYMKAKQKISQHWYELMRHRINNIHVLPQSYLKLNLQDQFKLVEQRAQKHFPYNYQQKNYMSVHENKIKLMKIEEKMRQILNQQNDPNNIELFQRFVKGQRSRQGIILYSKLLGKANIESEDRIKLPVFHYSAFRGIYKEYLRQFILKAEKNSAIQGKLKKRMKKVQSMMEEQLKKLEDPDQLMKYLTGQKGKAMNMSIDPSDGPQFSPQDLKDLQHMFGQMTEKDQKQMNELYEDIDFANNTKER